MRRTILQASMADQRVVRIVLESCPGPRLEELLLAPIYDNQGQQLFCVDLRRVSGMRLIPDNSLMRIMGYMVDGSYGWQDRMLTFVVLFERFINTPYCSLPLLTKHLGILFKCGQSYDGLPKSMKRCLKRWKPELLRVRSVKKGSKGPLKASPLPGLGSASLKRERLPVASVNVSFPKVGSPGLLK